MKFIISTLLLAILLVACMTQQAVSKRQHPRRYRQHHSATLSDSTQQLTITVDPQHANEWWVQLIANPSRLVQSIKLVTNGQSIHVPNVDWDNGKGEYFVVASPNLKIPFGSSVQIIANMRDGSTANTWLQWSQGQRASLSVNGGGGGGSSGPSNPSPSPSSGPKAPEPSDATKKFMNKVDNYHRSGNGPQAYITGEDSLRKRNKDKLRDALFDLGITDVKAKAFLFAAFGLESEQMFDWNGEAQRDRSKDGDKLSKNVSPLNMNIDMLKEIDFLPGGNAESLNKLENIKKTVTVAIQAVNKLGLEGFLNFHRGGRTGYEKPVASEGRFKMNAFRDGLFNIMKKYMEDHSLFNDGRKVWADIPWV